jgi:hypothetical protein
MAPRSHLPRATTATAAATWLLSATLLLAPAGLAAQADAPPEPQDPTASAATATAIAPPADTADNADDAQHHGEPAEGGEPESHAQHLQHARAGEHSSRLTDEVIPLQLEGFPQRPKPIVELGEPFLGTGTLDPGFELPTGAVWQPSLLVFGTLRTAVQSFGSGGARVSEWANRLDLFVNLQLSGSERLVLGLRPLDQDGRFTSYVFDSDLPGAGDGFEDEFNGEITSLFFEGDFGEIFPNLSRDDFSATDIGFSVGRQPLLFQEGLLIDDSIDGIGLTRNTLQPKNTSNFRSTFFWGWNEVGRSNGVANPEDDSAQLFGLLTSTDVRLSTVDADLVYVSSDAGDLLAGGISAVQRLGKASTSFRLLVSSALGDETALATDGVLLFSEISWTPQHSHDLVYLNSFWAFDEFSSAARGPSAGGPLGRAGINFAAVGLGSQGAALSARARDVAGAAIGYQRFFAGTRRQLIVELAGRVGTADAVADSYAATARYQAAFGRRFVFVVDGFLGSRQAVAPGARDQNLSGGRVELVLKF